MRTKTQSVERQNIRDIRKHGLRLVYQARTKAIRLKSGTSILKKIASIEQAIRVFELDRDQPGTFLKIEIKELENIISELDMRALTFMRRNRWKVFLIVLPFKLFVFLGFYYSSIPVNIYKINPTFYNILGFIIYLFLVGIFLVYFQAYLSLASFLIPLLKSVEASTAKKGGKPSKSSVEFFLASLFLASYTFLVFISGTMIPKFFSPSLPITFLSIYNAIVQIFNASPFNALAIIITIATPLILISKWLVSRFKSH